MYSRPNLGIQRNGYLGFESYHMYRETGHINTTSVLHEHERVTSPKSWSRLASSSIHSQDAARKKLYVLSNNIVDRVTAKEPRAV